MIVSVIKTPRITPSMCSLQKLLDDVITDMPDKSILAITSKIVALCEGAVVPIANTDKRQLIHDQSDLYLKDDEGIYGINFTVTQDTLIPNAGIDESNAGDVYVLWPKDSQKTANQIRKYLVERFGHKNLGVVITDSVCRPLRRGVSGIAIGYSGFKPLRNYVGQPDLFGRPFKVSQSDIVGGLAATAVLMMGEGTEATPIALMQDISFVTFVDEDPSDKELASLQISIDEDLFAPFLKKTVWLPGNRKELYDQS